MTMTVLTKAGAVEITSNGRTRVATLTAKGASPLALEAALKPFTDEQQLLQGTRPYPDGA